jgi:hypothetical protein
MHSAAVGCNQTKAKVARVPRHVGFRLDQPTGRGTANNAENANGALARPGARLEAMSLQPSFACLALFAVPLALRRCNRLWAMTLEGYCQATQRVIGRLSENHRGLRRFGRLIVPRGTETVDMRFARSVTIDFLLISVSRCGFDAQVLAAESLAAPSAARYAMRPLAIVATTRGTFGSTRIRSARNPSAIAPRSESPAAAAGFSEISPHACGRSSRPRPARIKAARSIAG